MRGKKAAKVNFGNAVLSTCLLSGFAEAEEKSARPPNILFILTDDLGIRDLGCYGSDYYRTPRLDQLAAEGMLFSNAYAAAPVCSPTRAAALTGLYPHRVHLTDALPWDRLPDNPRWIPPNHLKELPASYPTYAKALRAAGYRTALFGKWHLGNEHNFFERGKHHDYGFDEVFDAGYRDRNEIDKAVEALTAETLSFLERNQDRPFMLALHHHTPHVPLVCPPEFEALYDGVPKGELHQNQRYAGMMSHMDDATGRLLDQLDALGLSENTLVIFTSDNGGLSAETSNLPYRSGKATLYEGGIRVPLIIRWPGRIAPASVSAAVTTSTDFFPTFLEFAGLPLAPVAHRDGVSLMPVLLSGESWDQPRAVFWHLPHYRSEGPQSAVRSGEWKLVHNLDGETFELFNLAEDPGEENNLFAEETEKAAELQARLEEHLRETGAQRMRPNPYWDPDKPRGPVRNYGVFYPKHGGTFIVEERDVPHWFELAEPANPDWNKTPGRMLIIEPSPPDEGDP